MKQLNSILIFSLISIVVFSCKKDDDTASAKFHTPCNSVLDKWEITALHLPETQAQNDLVFIDEETGFTVGNAGTILKTVNGGQDWTFVERYYNLNTHEIDKSALTKARLLTVFFVDEAIGYVGGEAENIPISGGNIDAVLLKTKDGGDTWSKQYLPGVRSVKKLYFFDADNGLALFLISDENNYLKYKMYATHDAAATWEIVPMPNLTISGSQFDVSSISVGVWVVENYFSSKYLRSTDKGQTWQEVPIPSTECNSIRFQTDAQGTADCGGKSYKTTNGGNSWEEIIIADHTTDGAALKYFRSTTEGFAFVPVYDNQTGGGESWQVLNSFEVYQTTDGGINWKKSLIDKECDFTGTTFTYSDEVFYTLGWTAVNKFKLQ